MKKSRLFSLLPALCLLAGLLSLPAAAAEGGSAILDGMHAHAKAAILVDTQYGEVLYEQNAHEKMYPASITKVMTALLTLEAVDRGALKLEQVVTVSGSLHTGIGENASTAGIKEGEQVRVIDLLYAALLPSANEACNALAEAVSGSVAGFVALMNERAAELGMADTHFANTHGYHDDNHYTSAYDVSLMSAQAMRHETFRTIVGAKNYEMPATNLHEEPRIVRSTNALISNFRIAGYIYPHATGVKTGHTNEAGYCLAASAERDGRSLISVVMGCEREPDTTGSQGFIYFDESIRLLESGFSNFSRRTILDDTALDIAEVPVTLSKIEAVAVRPVGELAATLPKDVDAEDFVRSWKLDVESIEAPVQEGQVLGSITMSYGGKEYGTLPLVANASIERDELLYRLDRIQRFFDQLWVKLVLLAVAVLVVVLLLRRLFTRGRRGRGGHYAYSNRSRYSGGRRK